jgi:hypothetical protein
VDSTGNALRTIFSLVEYDTDRALDLGVFPQLSATVEAMQSSFRDPQLVLHTTIGPPNIDIAQATWFGQKYL